MLISYLLIYHTVMQVQSALIKSVEPPAPNKNAFLLALCLFNAIAGLNGSSLPNSLEPYIG